jgi:uncharacterized membrane protein YcaP (DUF421 family)
MRLVLRRKSAGAEAMNTLLTDLFGAGRDLNAWQMSARAVVVFTLVLIVVRVAGRRSFGRRTSFDLVVAILLGAVASRGIVGASPFAATMAACFVIACLHRATAWLVLSAPLADRLLNGPPRILYRHGELQPREMRRALISREDLLEGCRLAGARDLSAFAEIRLERSGRLSFIRNDQP